MACGGTRCSQSDVANASVWNEGAGRLNKALQQAKPAFEWSFAAERRWFRRHDRHGEHGAQMLLVALLLSLWHHGGYSPGFEPFVNVPLAPVLACKRLDSGDRAVDQFFCRDRTFEVLVRRGDDDSRLTLSEPEREATTVVLNDVNPFASEVYAVDLNRDAVDDVAVVFPTMGTGLASELCHVVFLLSSETGRAVHVMETMAFGAEDVIGYYGDSRYQIVHTEFVDGEPGRDGKTHNYWVYHFFTARGVDFELVKEIPARWIMFAGRSNHRPTRQLTEEQKAIIWAQRSRQFFLQ